MSYTVVVDNGQASSIIYNVTVQKDTLTNIAQENSSESSSTIIAVSVTVPIVVLILLAVCLWVVYAKYDRVCVNPKTLLVVFLSTHRLKRMLQEDLSENESTPTPRPSMGHIFDITHYSNFYHVQDESVVSIHAGNNESNINSYNNIAFRNYDQQEAIKETYNIFQDDDETTSVPAVGYKNIEAGASIRAQNDHEIDEQRVSGVFTIEQSDRENFEISRAKVRSKHKENEEPHSASKYAEGCAKRTVGTYTDSPDDVMRAVESKLVQLEWERTHSTSQRRKLSLPNDGSIDLDMSNF